VYSAQEAWPWSWAAVSPTGWCKSGLDKELDLVVGPSYKGSAIAQATAIALYEKTGRDLAFDYDRKEAKTHGEASGHGILFVTGAAMQGGKALVIDDVGTSMATKLDLLKKLTWLKPRQEKPLKVLGVALAVDREQTQAVYDDQNRLREGRRGPDALAAFKEETGLEVWSLLGVRQAVAYLHEQGLEVMIDGERGTLADEQMEQFQEYLDTYGR
jgi:orotate phosphoribosyltransferase